MALTKIVDTILPTTMVGSYPRPHWYHAAAQRPRRPRRVQEVNHEEAYHDATHAVIPTRRRPASTSSPTARCPTTTTSA